MKIYTLKSGRKIALTRFPRPRENDVVFFLVDEWRYIQQQGFRDIHKDFLWEQKSINFRYAIIPEKGLTEPARVVQHCRDILESFKKKTG